MIGTCSKSREGRLLIGARVDEGEEGEREDPKMEVPVPAIRFTRFSPSSRATDAGVRTQVTAVKIH